MINKELNIKINDECNTINNNFQKFKIRSVCKNDFDQLIHLHNECLPVKYDKDFFDSIINNYFQCFVAYEENDPEKIIGVITGVTKNKKFCEDSDGIVSWWGDELLTYIPTICVSSNYRRKGIAQQLLSNLIIISKSNPKCAAIYLHVLVTNYSAIQFYEKNNFIRIKNLKKYYLIDGNWYDAYLYALYVNYYKPPTSSWLNSFYLLKSVSYLTSLFLSFMWFPVKYICKFIKKYQNNNFTLQ
jgi:ribosomal protein S18 acetylase RimI-like enzyme